MINFTHEALDDRSLTIYCVAMPEGWVEALKIFKSSEGVKALIYNYPDPVSAGGLPWDYKGMPIPAKASITHAYRGEKYRAPGSPWIEVK